MRWWNIYGGLSAISASSPTSMARPPCRISWRAASYRAHLRKITRTYGQRARMLVDGLKRVLADRVQILRPDGGLQVCVPLPDAVEEAALVAALQARGFAVAGFSGYYLDHGRAGLVIGFAHAKSGKCRCPLRDPGGGIARIVICWPQKPLSRMRIAMIARQTRTARETRSPLRRRVPRKACGWFMAGMVSGRARTRYTASSGTRPSCVS